MNTTGVSFSFIFLIISSVNVSHPSFLCESGLSFSTVKSEFRRRTPSLAHLINDPLSGSSYPKSSFSSLKMFFSDGGFLIPSWTEKDKPSASPVPW